MNQAWPPITAAGTCHGQAIKAPSCSRCVQICRKDIAILTRTPLAARADDGSSWTDRVSEFTLGNGLHFIVLERHNAPVVSCSTYANVGAFDEETGKTGEPVLSREAVTSVLYFPTLVVEADFTRVIQ